MAIFFYFSEMAAVRHLGFVMRVLGPPTKAFDDLYHCEQNMVAIDGVVLIICMFFDFANLAGNAYSRLPFVWGGFDHPINGEPYQRNPKRAHPCVSPRRLSHHA